MSWEKFGSPYDPNYRGKMQRPQERREPKSYQLRGCGDPNCSMCNPETAALGLPGGSRGSGWENSSFTINEADSGRYIPPPSSFYTAVDTADSGSSQSGPSQSYREARKAVEKWLVKAPDQAFDDIVGNDEALGQLRDAIEAPVKHKALYEAYGMRMPKGAILSGPPGCGKTMFARAAASEMRHLYGGDAEFVSISGAELQAPFVGVTEGYIKAIFTYAREYKNHHGHPLLVFMDEADVLLPDRTGRVRRVASWEESQVATFLAEMDGIQESGAFVLLASNRPEVIDQAVLRDGRCDFKITVKRPTPEAIEIILRKNFAGVLTGADEIDTLVFSAVEALRDPFKVIAEASAIGINLAELKFRQAGQKHFLLEHIVSGAMCASIPGRATRHAFTRDKLDGVPRGVTVADVIAAVNDLFEENRSLEHAFALNEFKRDFEEEVRAAQKFTTSGGG